MAEALISVLLEQLASITRQQVQLQVKLVVDVKKEVENLCHNFQAIEAVLKDAEERQVKEASVKLWLDDLKDVSNEMEDVMDDWNTEILRLQIEKQEKAAGNALETTKKKRHFLHKTKSVVFSHHQDGITIEPKASMQNSITDSLILKLKHKPIPYILNGKTRSKMSDSGDGTFESRNLCFRRHQSTNHIPKAILKCISPCSPQRNQGQICMDQCRLSFMPNIRHRIETGQMEKDEFLKFLSM
ncbi:putative disease resistance protein RGA3 isoform X1 [Rosa chinensis]|uniref:putative disease resistance protein RGA3 isoform X1 n=1 Tax=Rosa chinensis TaxID=74649 RepID=UPI001AD8E8CE|nr:putative disease resistance protein RGA3 isoform X1 [Rosa chinensis]